MHAGDLEILFRAAAGPRLGFGHLVRCRSLARALGVRPCVSLRGSPRTRTAAARLGAAVAEDGGASFFAEQRRRVGHRLLVVDDPSSEHADVWVSRARRHRVPVATVHDLGLGCVRSDLTIDGSLRPRRGMSGRLGGLQGPAYAVLDPSIVRWREQRSRAIEPGRVVLALGGGAHVFTIAARLADAIVCMCPGTQLRVATGFAEGSHLPPLPHGRWITVRDGLGEELARADVAVLAGGVTLYEACAIGTPAIALSLTPAQGLTIRAVADAGAVIDGGPWGRAGTPQRVAAHVAHLLRDRRTHRRMHTAGRALVDGRGAFRVADRLRALVDPSAVRSSRVSAGGV